MRLFDAVVVEMTAVLIDRFGAFDLHAMAPATLLLRDALPRLYFSLSPHSFYPLNPLQVP